MSDDHDYLDTVRRLAVAALDAATAGLAVLHDHDQHVWEHHMATLNLGTTTKLLTHRVPSPYPRRLKNGAVAVDERCACGKLLSEHTDGTLAYGHGPTPDGECARFTWVEFVLASDK